MARIIYKRGFKGQNKIECIEGIEIEMMNGYCALIYPKYTDLPILYFKQYDDWKAKDMKEIEALKEENSKEITNELFALDSPAAKFVRQFKSDAFGHFSIPTLFTATEIAYQMEDIDELAKTIEGADILKKYGDVSSCSRYSQDSRWTVDGYTLFIRNHALCSSVACVPTIVYKKRRLRNVSSWMTDISTPTIAYKKPQTVYMVTSERAEKENSQSLIDEIKLFASFNDAKEYAKRKFEEILKIFGITKDNVKVEEAEKENSEELYFIQSIFQRYSKEWDVWVSIQKKEIE